MKEEVLSSGMQCLSRLYSRPLPAAMYSGVALSHYSNYMTDKCSVLLLDISQQSRWSLFAVNGTTIYMYLGFKCLPDQEQEHLVQSAGASKR